jgi:hypothetical protein
VHVPKVWEYYEFVGRVWGMDAHVKLSFEDGVLDDVLVGISRESYGDVESVGCGGVTEVAERCMDIVLDEAARVLESMVLRRVEYTSQTRYEEEE